MYDIKWGLKKTGKIILAVLTAIAFPVLIWVAAIFSFARIFREWRVLKGYVPDTLFTCRLDSDCPPGHMCINGRCLPDNGAF